MQPTSVRRMPASFTALVAAIGAAIVAGCGGGGGSTPQSHLGRSYALAASPSLPTTPACCRRGSGPRVRSAEALSSSARASMDSSSLRGR